MTMFMPTSWSFADGVVTGEVSGAIVDGARKAALLREIAEQERFSLEQVIAVGDGANDLPMLNLAGMGIAFRAKPLVRQSAEHSLSQLGLDGLLYLIGVRDRGFVINNKVHSTTSGSSHAKQSPVRPAPSPGRTRPTRVSTEANYGMPRSACGMARSACGMARSACAWTDPDSLKEMIKGITVIRPASSPAVYEALVSFFSVLGFEPGKGWDNEISRGRPFLAPLGNLEFMGTSALPPIL